MNHFLSDIPSQMLRLAQVSDAMERSWSMAQNGKIEERFLLYFAAIDDRANRVAELAQKLGAPWDLLRAWQAAFPQADALGFAINTNFTSVRLYVQYWNALAQRVKGGDISPAPLYVGFKSLPGGALRQDVYHAVPLAPAQVFLPPILQALAQFGVGTDTATSLARALNAETCIYTEVIGAERRSVLATLRRAPPDRAALGAALAAGTALGDNAATQHIVQQAGGYDLLHIATGEDPIKGAFSTLYFDTDIAQMTAALASKA